MLRRILVLQTAIAAVACAADLPIREVILFKHGVGYFARSGELKPGETARLDFKAEDMNDVLKSLTITDSKGGKVSGVRYDASETLEKRLQDFPFAVGGETSLAAFLDQMKGARLELRLASDNIAGTIVSARLVKASDKSAERETVMLLMDSGEMRAFDLAAASAVKLTDPKLQSLLKEYLAVLSQARSKDRRSVFIDSDGSTTHEIAARYMTPSPVWKSSYRLLFGKKGEPTLEGWAIIDNTSGEDWTNVHLSVVSGKPISFITQLYEPRYVVRPNAELAENKPVGPVVFQGAVGAVAADANGQFVPQRAAVNGPPAMQTGTGAGFGGGRYRSYAESSSITSAAGSDAGELFEYSFSSPVTVKKGESAMLPFLQQKVNTRKLLIYSESFGLHPMDAAEISNSTGKTLDGGPITVYDAGSYAGEALVETLKAGDKRLISYGVDLGTRISTAWDSSRDVVREIHLKRGVLTTRSAVEETKTYTIKNVDAKAKTLIIEHAERQGYKLLNQKPSETTANAYRFEVKLAGAGTETFPVKEERVFDQTVALTSATQDILTAWIQNKALSDAGRRQLEQIAQKKREIADNNAALTFADGDLTNLTQDQQRIRSNIQSLNNVSGQQDLVQQYARQLAASETKLATIRDRQAQLRRTKTTLESELNSLIEKADF
ncbi:MAG TPA: DUF4139 domain-containing protein [Bryobacteraceae bacterium]|nr:DUF4139 domain-containing protein [Bryobacteraceae bacterium]